MGDSSVASTNQRWELLKAYGLNSLSYHTMQPGLDYFDMFPEGYIAYEDYGPCRFALADPVCSRADLGPIVEKFDSTHKSVTFFHITQPTAMALDNLGYFVNEMGEEAIIDIPTYNWDGRKKMDIRHLHNTAKRKGLVVREAYGDRNIYAQTREISDQWLRRLKKHPKEMWFITRRPAYGDNPYVRKFYAYMGDKMAGYVNFDPVWAGQRIQGYCPSILRRLPDAPEGTLAWVIHEAMETFGRQGAKKLYLGLMPAYNIEDNTRSEFRYSFFTMRLFRWTYKSAITNRFYGFRSLSFHKRRYRAPTRKVYMATRSRFPIRELLFAGRMIGVI